jgi:mRNA interferase HicA
MKQRDLIKKFEKAGWEFYRHGGEHDIYIKDDNQEQIPRHREIKERLAQKLIKKWGLK